MRGLEELEGLAFGPRHVMGRELNALLERRMRVKPELDEGARVGVLEVLFPKHFERADFRRIRVRDDAFGQFEATGVRPSFVSRLEAAGIKLPTNLFQERALLRD